MSNRLDTCVRANSASTPNPPSDAGGNYTLTATTVGGITANQLYVVTSSVNENLLTLNAGSAIVKITVTISALTTSGEYWVGGWKSDDSNYLYARLIVFGTGAGASGYVELVKRVAGSPTAFKTSNGITISPGDTLSIERDSANDIIVKIAGVAVTWNTAGTPNDAFNNDKTNHGFGQFGGGAWRTSNLAITDNAAPSGSFTVSPTAIPKNHAGNITLTLAGTSTTWAGGGSEFSLSGVTGVTKVSENVTSATAATVVVTTGSGTGTLSLTDLDSIVGTTTVATATLTISPTSGLTGTTPTLTLTGTNTVWTQETAAGLFSVSGGTGASIGTPTITTNIAGTVVLTVGSGGGTLTVTDNSTGATATFTATLIGTLTNVVLLGDSRTFGTAASDAAHRYPARVAAILDSRFYTTNISAGTSGRSLDAPSGDDLRTDIAGTSAGGGSPNIPSYFNAGFAANILVAWGGFNDWNIDNTLTAAQLYTRLSAVVADGIAGGWTVFVCTETSSQEAGWDAKMVALNALIRHPSTGVKSLGAKGLIDRDQLLSAAGAYASANFSGGGPHMADAGQERIAVGSAAVLTQYADGFTGGGGGGSGGGSIIGG